MILEVVGETGSVSKAECLSREQFYLDWAFKTYGLLVLNYLRVAGSSLGFKHTEDTKSRLRLAREGLSHTEETKRKLSEMFKGELNPFSNKTHKPETLAKMSAYKEGENNPMYGKEKSPEFLAHMMKDRYGANNPQFGKVRSEEHRKKLSRLIYVYDASDDYKLIGVYGSVECAKELKIGLETIKKRMETGSIYRGKYFFSREPYSKSS